ncbi:MAG TPA: patatin-like phospholipase family protein [Blastocatellia bacterium]
MRNVAHISSSRTIGLALSGGSVRGLAHIGVIKALAEAQIQPRFIAGTSAGSIIGAALAAGMNWQDIAQMARSVFWPALLNGQRLERFCAEHLPESFAELRLPFTAIATDLHSKRPVTLYEGRLATAISASCAMRVIRRCVIHKGQRLKDGGITCVLPTVACREMGAEFVIASDVWELSSILRSAGFHTAHPRGERLYPSHYREAVRHSDLLVTPSIPKSGYLPGVRAVDLMIEAGERATHKALARLTDQPAS